MHKPIYAILLYEAYAISFKLRSYFQQYEEGRVKRVVEWIFTFLFVGIRILYGLCYCRSSDSIKFNAYLHIGD
jgi:hypothetical protein